MEKFTQGEWKIVCSDDETFMRSVCQVSGDCFINSSQKLSEDLLADARLIAAAPDMYRMLNSVMGEMHRLIDEVNDQRASRITSQTETEPDYHDEETLHLIQVLLAKARGESCD